MNYDFSHLDVVRYSVAAGSALAILVIGWLLAGWASGLVRKAAARSGRISPTLVPLFAKLTRLAIHAAVLLAALEKVGVQTGGFFAMIGAAGLAVGLALRDTMSDAAAGIVLLVLRPFDVGETVDIGATSGTVTAIDIFQTKLLSAEGVPIMLNNSAVRTAVIRNYSRAQTRRIDLEIRIDYGEDIAKARATIRQVLEADSRVLRQPAFEVNSLALTDTAVVLLARCTTRAPDFWETKLDLVRTVKEALAREGIDRPVPQQAVHLINSQAS
jgi:small conductance mechanosensitive channel